MTDLEMVCQSVPRGLAAFAVKPPALFLANSRAAERFFGFFTANIRNKNTRRAYYKAACRFYDRRNDETSLDEYEKVGI
jgi:hypothetical protein